MDSGKSWIVKVLAAQLDDKNQKKLDSCMAGSLLSSMKPLALGCSKFCRRAAKIIQKGTLPCSLNAASSENTGASGIRIVTGIEAATIAWSVKTRTSTDETEDVA